MDAKDKEIAQLRAELKESKDAHESDAMDYASKVDEMRTELDAIKSQKPIGYWRHTFAGKLCINKSLQCDIDGNSPELPDSTPLYARPVPAIPEGMAIVPIEPTEQADEITALKSENIALRKVWGDRCEELDVLKRQRSVGIFRRKQCTGYGDFSDIDWIDGEYPSKDLQLYARPVPAIPDCETCQNRGKVRDDALEEVMVKIEGIRSAPEMRMTILCMKGTK